MPALELHKQITRWAQEYGPIYSLILGTKVMIILSDDQSVKELLDKKSGIYSSRPHMFIGNDIRSGGLRFSMQCYGSQWRYGRKLFQGQLNITAANSYVPYQDLENKQMLFDMLELPRRFLENIRRYIMSLTTSITFG